MLAILASILDQRRCCHSSSVSVIRTTPAHHSVLAGSGLHQPDGLAHHVAGSGVPAVADLRLDEPLQLRGQG